MFEKLEYVYAVYKEGSFTKAAEKLYISQPSLSAAVRNVEKEIGAPLFNRGGSVTLTEVGREYIRAAERMIALKEEFLNRVNDIYNLEVGHITVGGTNYLSSYVLPRIITRFSELYPSIEVTLAEANSKTLSEMIEREEIDIVVDSFDKSLEDYIGYPLASERILLCVPSDLPINKRLEGYAISPESIYNGEPDAFVKEPVPINIFKDESFVMLKNGNDMYHRAIEIFEKAGISPKISFSVDQLNISYFLAESGMGLCFATDTLFRFGRFRSKVRLYNVAEEHSNRTLYVAHKKNKYCTRAMSKFIEIAKEVIRSSKKNNTRAIDKD